MFYYAVVLVNSLKNNGISFTRALNSKELRQFNAVQKQGRELVGQTGQSIFIVHDSCLPQSSALNTGAANLAMKESQDFLEYMKSYLGFNTVQILPAGELCPNNKFYCPYSSSALSLGMQQINPALLTEEKYGSILTQEEFQEIDKKNTAKNKDEIVNFSNVADKNSAQESILKKAYMRFKAIDENTALKRDFRKYIKDNDDWLEPKAIYKILENEHKSKVFSNWYGIDSDLYNFNYQAEEKRARINQILKEHSDEIEFYKFKQFLAEEHLAEGRKKLNEMGLKLTGDCEINFSKDEIWANPDAFKYGSYIGESDWAVECLDFDSIKNPESASAKLLKRKVQLNAQRYDGIRFDAGWAYVNPYITDIQTGRTYPKYLGEDVLQFIEKAVKEIKGEDYDLKNLIYEFQGGEIFSGTKLLPPIEKRVKVQDSVYMKDNHKDIYGSNDAFIRRGWAPDSFVIGVGNHDSQPLRQIANDIPDLKGEKHKTEAIEALAKIFKVSPESLNNPIEFVKAKFAEPMTAKNNMVFYMDVFGREENFNMHQYNNIKHPEKNFAYKIPSNYKEAYHNALQEGYGFNIMDSLEKAFKLKGLDKTQPELYAEIIKFRDILYEKGPSEGVKSGIKGNKFTKPLLLAGAIICAICGAIYLKGIKNKKEKPQENSQIPTVNNVSDAAAQIKTTSAMQNIRPADLNMQNFLNSAAQTQIQKS